MYNPQRDEIEIDLIQLIKECWKKWWIFAIAIVVAAGLGYGITQIKYVPMYQSTATMYILPNDQLAMGDTGVAGYGKLPKDCAAIVTMPSLLETALSDTGLEDKITVSSLAGRVSSTVIEDTSLVNVSVSDLDPNNAKILVDAVTANAVRYISENMQAANPRFIEAGQVPGSPIGSNAIRNAVLGAVIGFVMSFICVFISMYIADYKKREEYLTKHR